jgi:hypothetical protein
VRSLRPEVRILPDPLFQRLRSSEGESATLRRLRSQVRVLPRSSRGCSSDSTNARLSIERSRVRVPSSPLTHQLSIERSTTAWSGSRVRSFAADSRDIAQCGVERAPWEREVTGSNPVIPTVQVPSGRWTEFGLGPIARHRSRFSGGVAQSAEALVSDTRGEGSNPSIPTSSAVRCPSSADNRSQKLPSDCGLRISNG